MFVYNFLPVLLLTSYFQREVKVSRDGTEIEPTVGQRLIDEWEEIGQAPGPNPVGETAKSSPPIAPLPRSAGGRARSIRNVPGADPWASRAS